MILINILYVLFHLVHLDFVSEQQEKAINFQFESNYFLSNPTVHPDDQDSIPPIYQPEFVHCNTTTVIKEVVSTTGRRWMDRNLGASRVARSTTDSLAFGDLFQWGRFADGHQCRKSEVLHIGATTSSPFDENVWHGKFITTIIPPYDWLVRPESSLWQDSAGKNNPCPTGYRIPTCAEWKAEWKSWKPGKSGAFQSPLRLPEAGLRGSTRGHFLSVGEYGLYWSSTPNGSKSCGIYFYQSDVGTYSYFRGRGLSVRCIRDRS